MQNVWVSGPPQKYWYLHCFVKHAQEHSGVFFHPITSTSKAEARNNKHTSFPSTAVKISLFVAAHDQPKMIVFFGIFFLAAAPPDFPKYGKMPKRA